MKFLDLLRRQAGDRVNRALALVAISGVFQGAAMAAVNGAAFGLAQGGATGLLFFLFLACVVGAHLTTGGGLREGTALSEGTIRAIRLQLADKIRRTDLERFERLQEARLHSYLTTELVQISEGSLRIISSIAAACMVIFSFLYIAYLLPAAYRITALFVGIGFGVYALNYPRLKEGLEETSNRETDFVEVLSHLLGGFKELRIDAAKNEDLFQSRLVPAVEAVRSLGASIRQKYARHLVFAHACFFVALGCVVFLLPLKGEADPFVIFKIAIVILFLIGPLEGLASAVPFLDRANVAAANIAALEDELERLQSEPGPPAGPEAPASPLREIRLEGATFDYPGGESGPSFAVGPLEFSVRAGEIVFITGGNGSGKTTFMKVLAGLYPPRSGSLRVNGELVGDLNRQAYRERIGAVFTDFHLFDRFYGSASIDEQRVRALLKEMQLEGKTSYADGRFTSLELSTGQKKRLALVMCLAENRDLLMFDELAADQDPVFRDHIYNVLMVNLQQSGKTIVAITHDDRYFSRADRVLRMQDGRFVSGGDKFTPKTPPSITS